MGWKSSLLLGDPALLSQLFPGWKPPLRPPARRLNPFTRKREPVEVASYDDDEAVPLVCDWKRLRALDPPRISQTFDPDHLETLAKILRVRGKAYRRALSEPGGSVTVVLELTERFVEALSAITEELVRDLAGTWSAGTAGEELTRTVEALRRMASDAIAGRRFLYLVNET